MKVAEIKEKLTDLGVEFDEKANKDELKELLDKQLSEKENGDSALEEKQKSQTESTEEEELEELEPKQYVVIHDFKDLEDNGTIYIKDDIYPRRVDTVVEEERIQELMSSNNKIGKPLIKEQD